MERRGAALAPGVLMVKKLIVLNPAEKRSLRGMPLRAGPYPLSAPHCLL
jgi:hypothetical protein